MRTVLLLVALAILPASDAMAAATVSASTHPFQNYRETDYELDVVASGDARNDDLTATRAPSADSPLDEVVVRDLAGAVAAEGCEQVDATTVRCAAPVAPALWRVTLDGGAGDDVLRSSSVARTLLGGEGADHLVGTSRSVTLDGGPGPDVMSGPATVTYADRARPVHVDLRRSGPVQGEAGEGDSIDGAVAVTGGHGSDTLAAGTSAVRLFGGPGRDVLIGGRRRDVLDGGPGRDRLFAGESRSGNVLRGGPGDDLLRAGRGPDSLDGGSGRDATGVVAHGDLVEDRDDRPDLVTCVRAPRLVILDRLDLVLGCTRTPIHRRGAPRPGLLQTGNVLDYGQYESSRTALVEIGCPDDMPGDCVVDVALRDPQGAAGGGRVTVAPGADAVRHVPLSDRASRHARCSGHLRLTYIVSLHAADGTVSRQRWHIRAPVQRRRSAC